MAMELTFCNSPCIIETYPLLERSLRKVHEGYRSDSSHASKFTRIKNKQGIGPLREASECHHFRGSFHWTWDCWQWHLLLWTGGWNTASSHSQMLAQGTRPISMACQVCLWITIILGLPLKVDFISELQGQLACHSMQASKKFPSNSI